MIGCWTDPNLTCYLLFIEHIEVVGSHPSKEMAQTLNGTFRFVRYTSTPFPCSVRLSTIKYHHPVLINMPWENLSPEETEEPIVLRLMGQLIADAAFPNSGAVAYDAMGTAYERSRFSLLECAKYE